MSIGHWARGANGVEEAEEAEGKFAPLLPCSLALCSLLPCSRSFGRKRISPIANFGCRAGYSVFCLEKFRYAIAPTKIQIKNSQANIAILRRVRTFLFVGANGIRPLQASTVLTLMCNANNSQANNSQANNFKFKI